MPVREENCDCFTYPCNCPNHNGYYDKYGVWHNYGSIKINGDPIELQPHNCNPLYDKNCMDNTLDVLNNVRPLTNTNYPPVNNVFDWSSIFNTRNNSSINTSIPMNTNPVAQAGSGIFQTIKDNPLISLAIAGTLAYFFLGGGGGTYEQITTKRKGF